MRRRSEVLFLFFSLGILFSCRYDGQNGRRNDIEISDWTSSTLNSISNACGVSDLDSEINPKLRMDGTVLSSVREQINFMLQTRVLFDSMITLSNIPIDYSKMKLIELYEERPVFILKSSDNTFYSITFSNYGRRAGYVIKTTDSYDDWFIAEKCVNKIASSNPFYQGLYIVNEIESNGNKVDYNCKSITIF